MRIAVVIIFILLMLPLFKVESSDIRAEVQQFIDEYTKRWNELRTIAVEAEWQANIKIVEGDDTNARATREAQEKLAEFTGSKENIERAQKFLKHRDKLTELQVRQLEVILFNAANNPATVKELVKRRIAAEVAQNEKLYGYDFKLKGQSISTNQIDDLLKRSVDLRERREVWLASKEVGTRLKDGLAELRDLRNATVRALGYRSYFSYMVSEYGMTAEQMLKLVDDINRQLRPLYRELHTYARYELAKKYKAPVPEYLPADWLPNRWGQDWSPMLEVEGLNLDAALKDKSAEWIVEQAEDFYKSLGFQPLPKVFWEKSSLYPLPPDAKYKKNTHASAWHMDNDTDVRSLMSVEPNAEWYETTHHELGHIYYYLTYSNPDVPLLLRQGANRAYHEAIGSLMGLAAMQRPFLEQRGLVSKDARVDQMQALLKEALNYVVFIPFSAGVMSHFEYELYEKNLPKSKYNARWWELVKKYQGIVPPMRRSEAYCDACTKTHINDDPAAYYDYALSYVLLFQLHDHIAKMLKQDPHATNYYGQKAAGDFLKQIMRPGSSRNWRLVLRENTGEDLSAAAMVRYFEPLLEYLKQVNKGRKHTLPQL
ncbi:MAG: M2 family metallopeptidase [Acidobacteriota bacterium]|nr:M2 family metallopeptidase [Blastocatellia bacterium]MDW8411670.1 M2 family metallopeptidase [Acidobacteriota bacterium]